MISHYKVICLKDYELPYDGPYYENYVGFEKGEIYDAQSDSELALRHPGIKWEVKSDYDEINLSDDEFEEWFKISITKTRKEKISKLNEIRKSNIS